MAFSLQHALLGGLRENGPRSIWIQDDKMHTNGQDFGASFEGLDTERAVAEETAQGGWRYGLSTGVFGAREEAAVLHCLRATAQSPGQATRAFEQAVAQRHGSRHAIAVASGPAALHLALLAAEVGQSPDDEVIQPALNSTAAANMTAAVGANPVFADIVSLTEPTIDPDDVERLVGPNTKAVVAMHYGGYPARLDALVELCRRQNLALIEQSCHGLGIELAELNNRALGTFGHFGCFSFAIGPGAPGADGGLLVTDDDELAARVRSLMWQAASTLSPNRGSARKGVCDVLAHGFSYRMSDLHAALALAELDKLAAETAIRQKRAQAYANVVETFCDGAIEYVFGWAPGDGNASVAAILVEPSVREGLRGFLTDKRIETRLHFQPLHKFQAFAECRASDLSLTREFAEQVVTLPISADLPVMAPEHIIRFCTTYLAGQSSAPAKASKHHLKVA